LPLDLPPPTPDDSDRERRPAARKNGLPAEAPIPQRFALIAGATGLVGSVLLKALVAGGDYARVYAITRRPLLADHPRLSNRVLPLEQVARLSGIKVTDAFCCLGAPQARSATVPQLRAVDLELTLQFARAASALGARRFVVISAAGADRSSPKPFLRVKGEMEAALRELKFPAVDILQPGSVSGLRDEMHSRAWLRMLLPLASPLLQGGLAERRAVSAADLAAAMLGAARAQRGGVHVYAGTSLQELARSAGRRS
jgi:uncharacterized protein YbjT (DUF2867 family)